MFGKHFRDVVGNEKCRKVNRILMRYNFPRYPNQPTLEREEVEDKIEFISEFIEYDIHKIIK